MIKYAIDIDGTICDNTWGNYEEAVPNLERIDYINYLYESGNEIKMFTARGSATKKDWFEFTKKQLESWGLKYHHLIMGKPDADIFIDDKAINDSFWLWKKQKISNTGKNSKVSKFFDRVAISFNHISQDVDLLDKIELLGRNLSNTISNRGKIFFAGNGGSFGDSQHIAAEFVAKLNIDRVPLPAIALGTNTSSTTAIGNDYGYEQIFCRELKALGNKLDYLVVFSTSGESKNIISLQEIAKSIGIKSALITGPNKNSKACKLSELVLNTPEGFNDTASIQHMHIAIGHYICEVAQKPFI